METLLQIANIQQNELKKYLLKRVSSDLNDLSEPCFYPKLKRDYYEFLNFCGLKDSDVKNFVKYFYRGRPESAWILHKSPETNLLIFIMYFFLSKKEILGYSLTMKYFCIRYYTNLINKQIRFCNSDGFKSALELIPKIHLFSREGSIPGAIIFMSSEMEKKYIAGIASQNKEKISAFIVESRTRISRSIKSFAEKYYEVLKTGTASKTYEEKTSDEESPEELVPIAAQTRFSEEIAKKICVYKQVDYNSHREAASISKVPSAISNIVISELTNIKYFDNLKIIITLYLKNIQNLKINICDENQYYKHLRGLVALKRTSERIYFKQQISVLLEKILTNRKFLEEPNTREKFNIILFLSIYITLFIKKTLCGK